MDPAARPEMLPELAQAPVGGNVAEPGIDALPSGQMPASPSSLLEVLRDLQTPAEIPWWPPAVGWWILMAALLLAYAQWRHAVLTRWFRKPPPDPLLIGVGAVARSEMAEIRRRFDETRDVHALVSSLSVLLKRVSLEFFPREEAASLTGEAWLRWLDGQSESDVFSSGIGRPLADAPYKKPDAVSASVDGDALLKACEGWLLAVIRRRNTD